MFVGQFTAMTSARLSLIDVDASLRVAALSFLKPAIGLVVACRANGEAVGVLSKSDLVRHMAHSGDASTGVAALMSQPFISCIPDDDLHSAWQKMAAKNLQNMPVLNAGSKPIGVLDIRDAMKVLFEQEELQERLLADYIAGIGYR